MRPFKHLWAMLGAVLLVSSLSAAADALTVLNDAAVFARVQKDVAEAPRADLDALAEAVTTCAAVSIGQRPQQFDCERGVNLYWTRYNRGRSLDDYMGAVGGLFAAFDNNALNPTQEMSQTYRHVSSDLVSLMKTINKRYRQLDK